MQTAPYGTWRSVISPELVVENALHLGEIQIVDDDIYWVEGRASEGGRSVLMRASSGGDISEMLPQDVNLRTRVHEYGGRAFHITAEAMFYVNYADQSLHQRNFDGEDRILGMDGNNRFADFCVDTREERLFTVMEVHTRPGEEPRNLIAAIDLAGGSSHTVVHSGHDFYSNPVLDPSGTKLAFLSWNHPNMPWDGTQLWVMEILADGGFGEAQHIAGGEQESVFQPQWGSDEVLYFVSDPTGWWNLYRWSGGQVEPVLPLEAEFGLPQWVFGMSTYAVLDEDELMAIFHKNGEDHLVHIPVGKGDAHFIETPFTTLTQLRSGKGSVAFIGGRADIPRAVVRMDLETGSFEELRPAQQISVDRSYFSEPDNLTLDIQGRDVQAWYYPPRNPEYSASAAERPPLVVKSHGGPTSRSEANLSMEIQFWTSRGFAVADVNYSGSTGYGREYRERLNGNWGVLDVEDCTGVAEELSRMGMVDPDRLIIRGGSAGGYTTLCALSLKSVFKAGASYYGVSNLEDLATETHKFESRYLDSMVGPYPEKKELYQQRSAINHLEGLDCPIIFFQGEEDPVVPPAQAEMMVAAMKEKGLPVAYVSFPGEAHGFRQAENIMTALKMELAFYGRVFGFEPADLDVDLPLENAAKL